MSAHVRGLLSDFIDGELPDARRDAVEAHLGACADCRRELESLREVGRLLRSSPRRPLPEGFLHRLSLRRDARPRPNKTLALAFAGVAAAFVLADQARQVLRDADGAKGLLPPSATMAVDWEQARAAKPEKALAKARGEPLGGLAIAPAITGPSNEELQADLERQKRRLGIRGVAARRGSSPTPPLDRLELKAADPPPQLAEGQSPVVLASPEAGGAPVAAVAASTPAATQAEGYVLRSEEERLALWSRLGLRLNPPRMNYSRGVLVLVVAPDMGTAVEILGVQTLKERLSVRYRMFARLGGASEAAPVRAYQFRVVPRVDKPVSFDRTE